MSGPNDTPEEKAIEDAEFVAASDAETEPHPDAKPAEAKPDKPAKGPGLVPLVLVALVSIAISLGVANTRFNQWQETEYVEALNQSTSLAEQTATVQGEVQAIDGKVVDAVGEVKSVRDEFGGLKAEVSGANERVQELKGSFLDLEAQQAQLGDSIQQLFNRRQEREGRWQLQEIESLLIIANQRLRLQRDVSTALAALQEADRRVGATGNPGLTPLRQALAKEIASLRAVPEPDITGLALELGAMVDRISGLPVAGGIEADRAAAVAAPDVPAEPIQVAGVEIPSALLDMADTVAGFMDVKQLDMPEAVMHDPDARHYLYQNLRLELASARLAVLRSDSDNLHSSTARAAGLLESFYDTSNQEVASILQRCGEFGGIDLAPELPDISGSLAVLRGYRAAILKDGEGQAEGDAS